MFKISMLSFTVCAMTGWEEDQNNNPVGDLLLLSNNL